MNTDSYFRYNKNKVQKVKHFLYKMCIIYEFEIQYTCRKVIQCLCLVLTGMRENVQ
jgi:hypothetical protein